MGSIPGNQHAGEAVGRFRRGDLLQDFSDYMVGELDRSPRTAESYLYALRSLAKFSGKPIEKCSSADLRRYKREAQCAQSTKQGVVVAAKAFHQWGALEGYWKLNGIMGVKTNRVVQPAKPPISQHTVRTLLSACSRPLEFRVIFLGLYAGCRIAESAKMDEASWRLDRLVFTGKGRKQRTVPLHPELQDMKQVILSEKPSSDGVLQSSLARLRDKTNARDLDGKPVTSHALRRTFADTLYNHCEVPYEVVAKLLGHGEDVTARYARIGYPKLAAAIASLTYFSGEPIQLSLF